jgi:hypothetical protein
MTKIKYYQWLMELDGVDQSREITWLLDNLTDEAKKSIERLMKELK